ncbi:Sodium channel and clathrin linker 1 [Nymphon striatum]|nr:Sodium channel and clathrin linker 1 [Nymphon striatum]
MKLWHLAVMEIERLEKNEIGRADKSELKEFEVKATQLESEVNSSKLQDRSELNNSLFSLEVASHQERVEKAKAEIANVKSQLESQDEYQQEFSRLNETCRPNVFYTKQKSKDVILLTQPLEDTFSQHCKGESLEAASANQLRDYAQVAENALLEKDAAISRERLALNDVNRLEKSINQLMNEAGNKVKMEVDKVKLQCNSNIEEVVEQIQQLELELSKSKTFIERITRERNSAVAKLNNFDQPLSSQIIAQSTKELSEIICARDEAYLEIDRLKNHIKVAGSRHEQDVSNVNINVSQLHSQLANLMKNLQRVSDERLHLAKQIEGLQDSVKSSEERTQLMKLKYEKKIAYMSEEYQHLEEKSKIEQRSWQESQRNLKNNMQKQLRMQGETIIMLKEQISSLQQQNDLQQDRLKSEVEKQSNFNKKLQSEINYLKSDILKKEKKLKYYEEEFMKMDKRLSVTEQAVESCKVQSSPVHLNHASKLTKILPNSSMLDIEYVNSQFQLAEKNNNVYSNIVPKFYIYCQLFQKVNIVYILDSLHVN